MAVSLCRLEKFKVGARKQTHRQIMAARLAHRIAGRPVHLEHTPDGLLLIDTDSDHIIMNDDHGGSEAERFATLLLLGAEDRNHAAGILNGNEDQTFEGSLSLWKPSLRLDPNWMEAMRRRTRKEARKRFETMEANLKTDKREAYGYANSYRWAYGPKMMTLTMPPIEESDTLREVKRFNAAFRNLQKSDFWQGCDILGGIKAVEDRLTAAGPHVHGHFLLISRKIDQDGLRAAWESALRKATRAIYAAPMPGPVAIPDLRRVRAKARREGEISLDAALDEVCKYLTKTCDLLDQFQDSNGKWHQPAAPDALLALCAVKRWPRMVEMLGAARRVPRAAEGGPASLDTSCISVQEFHSRTLPLPDFWEEGAIEPEERLDYALQLRAANGIEVASRRERPPSWRELMAQTTLHDWLQMIVARVSAGRRYRLGWLRSHNKDLYLVSMDGTEYRADEWPDMEN